MNWGPSCHPLPSVMTLYLKVQIYLKVLKRCFAPPGSLHKDLFAPPIGVKHPKDNIVHTFPGNCNPKSNSAAGVTIASHSKLTKCHTSGYINSTAFGHKSNLVSQQGKRAEDVQ